MMNRGDINIFPAIDIYSASIDFVRHVGGRYNRIVWIDIEEICIVLIMISSAIIFRS